jgi:3-hydroxybutyrate dehydrogenase
MPSEIDASGKRATGVMMDVASGEQVEAGAAKAIETFGRLDVLISNAGITETASHILPSACSEESGYRF